MERLLRGRQESAAKSLHLSRASLEYSILASRNHSRLARGARVSTVSPYLDACFRTNTKSIMRAIRENRAARSFLSFSSLTRASARGEREGSGGARSYSPLLHPWQHHRDGSRARSDQCHRRAPLCFVPTVFAVRSSWRQHPYRPHQDQSDTSGGVVG